MSQLRSKLDANQVLRDSFDEGLGRLRVDAEVTASIGTVDVIIDAATGDNIAISDSTGTNSLAVNPDGSLNVNVAIDQANDSIAIGDGTNLITVDNNGALLVTLEGSNLTTKNVFGEVDNVVSGVTTVIATYTALANTKLLSVDVGGSNVATYSIWIGSTLSAKKYTYYTNLNERFVFGNGLPVNTGDIISVEVVHQRPDAGNFNCNILIEN